MIALTGEQERRIRQTLAELGAFSYANTKAILLDILDSAPRTPEAASTERVRCTACWDICCDFRVGVQVKGVSVPPGQYCTAHCPKHSEPAPAAACEPCATKIETIDRLCAKYSDLEKRHEILQGNHLDRVLECGDLSGKLRDLEKRAGEVAGEMRRRAGSSLAIWADDFRKWADRLFPPTEERKMRLWATEMGAQRIAFQDHRPNDDWTEVSIPDGFELRPVRERDHAPPECSICRRRHGLEVQHASE